MTESRRRWFMTAVGAISVFTAKSLLCGQAQQTQGRPRPGSPPLPNPSRRNPFPDSDEPQSSDLKAIQQENQQKLRADVSRLYEMAADLKAEVEKTDATATLSVSLFKKAQEIERLAKRVRILTKDLS